MKKIKIIALALTALLLASITISYAEIEYVSARYSHTSLISAEISISVNIARCSGLVKPSSSANSSKIVANLQRKVNGTWQTITSWSGSAINGRTAQAGGSYTITSGYEYRVLSVGKVISPSGVVLEETSATSATQSY